MKTQAHTELQKHVLSLVQERQRKSTLISVGELKKLIKKPMTKIVEAAEDMQLCVNVGIGGPGGYGKLPKSQWTIEDLNAPYHEA